MENVEDFVRAYWKSPSMKSATINYIYYTFGISEVNYMNEEESAKYRVALSKMIRKIVNEELTFGEIVNYMNSMGKKEEAFYTPTQYRFGDCLRGDCYMPNKDEDENRYPKYILEKSISEKFSELKEMKRSEVIERDEEILRRRIDDVMDLLLPYPIVLGTVQFPNIMQQYFNGKIGDDFWEKATKRNLIMMGIEKGLYGGYYEMGLRNIFNPALAPPYLHSQKKSIRPSPLDYYWGGSYGFKREWLGTNNQVINISTKIAKDREEILIGNIVKNAGYIVNVIYTLSPYGVKVDVPWMKISKSKFELGYEREYNFENSQLLNPDETKDERWERLKRYTEKIREEYRKTLTGLNNPLTSMYAPYCFAHRITDARLFGDVSPVISDAEHHYERQLPYNFPQGITRFRPSRENVDVGVSTTMYFDMFSIPLLVFDAENLTMGIVNTTGLHISESPSRDVKTYDMFRAFTTGSLKKGYNDLIGGVIHNGRWFNWEDYFQSGRRVGNRSQPTNNVYRYTPNDLKTNFFGYIDYDEFFFNINLLKQVYERENNDNDARVIMREFSEEKEEEAEVEI